MTKKRSLSTPTSPDAEITEEEGQIVEKTAKKTVAKKTAKKAVAKKTAKKAVAKKAAKKTTKKAAKKAATKTATAAAEPRKTRRTRSLRVPVETVAVSSLSVAERAHQIAEAAYFRAEARGFAPGGEVEDWIAAEAEVDARITRMRA